MMLLRWLDRLRQELRQRGLPASYSARLIEELTEHFTDIQMENQSMDAQQSVDEVLGTPESLACAAQEKFASRTFAGRHPFLAFVLWPVPAAILVLVAITLVVVLPSEWIVDSVKARSLISSAADCSTTNWIIAYFDLYVLRFVPFVFTAWLFIGISRRAKSPAWGLAACVCVAYFAFMFRGVIEPPTDQRDLRLRIGLCVEHGLHQWQNGLVQMAIPLFMGFWAWRKQENWLSHGKRPLLVTICVTCLFTTICFAPLPNPFLKLANAVVFAFLILSAFIGSGICIAADRSSYD